MQYNAQYSVSKPNPFESNTRRALSLRQIYFQSVYPFYSLNFITIIIYEKDSSKKLQNHWQERTSSILMYISSPHLMNHQTLMLPFWQCRVLLNLRTSQPFEEVLEDLGQVLKMNGAKRMYTVSGQEVRSFSQLRNEFADVDTFYLGVGPVGGGVMMSPARRSRSRAPQTAIVEDLSKQRRARSKSRPRALYAPESEIVRNSGKC